MIQQLPENFRISAAALDHVLEMWRKQASLHPELYPIGATYFGIATQQPEPQPQPVQTQPQA